MTLTLQAIVSNFLAQDYHLHDYFDSLPGELKFVIGEHIEPLLGLSDDQREIPFALGTYIKPMFLPQKTYIDRFSYPCPYINRRQLVDNGHHAPDTWLSDFFVRGVLAGMLERTPLVYNPFDRDDWRCYDISASAEILQATGKITPDDFVQAVSISMLRRSQEDKVELTGMLFLKLRQGIKRHCEVILTEFSSNSDLLSAIIKCLSTNRRLSRLGIFWCRHFSALGHVRLMPRWNDEDEITKRRIYLLDEAVEISQTLVYHHVQWAVQRVYDALAAEDLSDIRTTLEHKEPAFYWVREIARFVDEISEPIYNRPFTLEWPLVDTDDKRYERLEKFFETNPVQLRPYPSRCRSRNRMYD